MDRTKRIVILIITVVVMAAAVAGVAWGTANLGDAAKAPGLYVKGKMVEDPGVIVSIGSHDVMAPEFRHYTLMYKYYFESLYGIDFANDPDGDYAYELQNAVVHELSGTYALLDYAEKEGITLNEEDIADIEAVLADQKQQYGDDFEAQLAETFFMDEENYLDVTKKQWLADKANNAFYEKIAEENETKFATEAAAEFENSQLSAKHILINVDLENEDYEQAKKDALEKAEDILADIMEAEDIEKAFNEAMHKYSEDGGLESNPDGYTFGEGQMVDVFYQTTKSLKVGEVSQPVLSEATNYTGYHIILRQELASDEKTDYINNYISSKIAEEANSQLEEMQNALDVVYGTYYNNATATNFK